MARQARAKSKTGVYHIMWRGANRQEIFHDDEDRVKFLSIFDKYKTKSEMSVYAWCLMDNHAHFLVKEGEEEISTTMKRIGVSFVGYYNIKYRTTGHLFQDRFKSENVETARYLLTVARYIHQNPVKAEMVANPSAWKWSSCSGYYGKKMDPPHLLDCEFILKMFSDDVIVAREGFKIFNERVNEDKCLEMNIYVRKRLLDEEARIEIKNLLGEVEIAHVKNFPKLKRDKILRHVKQIEGVSHRQAARILGVSSNLVFKA